ncbi:unnamed protein product [Pseudo-nitzschia multistriata]|uniref:EGF-like domain-containing protein n=1 Tax=Pseudo-nitzschia multistriata TaxID=183589 RepID=A0A448ZBS2_9STRA|nr:unnamed protein product [Pseudo-nitzschia multistriata]
MVPSHPTAGVAVVISIAAVFVLMEWNRAPAPLKLLFYDSGPLEIVDFENTDACSAYIPEKKQHAKNPIPLFAHDDGGGQGSDNTIKVVELNSSFSLEECAGFAASWRDSNGALCRTACWFNHQAANDNTVENRCFCLTDPIWMPQHQVHNHIEGRVDSARLVWPCRENSDCSYNGHCSDTDHRCHCREGWKGLFCDELYLLPMTKDRLGFREVDTSGRNVSSWGAPILFDESSKIWHGFVSEIQAGCGINAWQTNSRIVHVVGDSPYGPFERKEIVFPVFAHEASVVRGPRGEWVMLFSFFHYNETGLAAVICSNCRDGVTPEISPKCPFQRGSPKKLRHKFRQMMSLAESPDGPWSTPLEIPQLSQNWDWNTDLTINRDGSAVALIRCGMTWHAQNYSDPTTWHPVGSKHGKGSEGPCWTGAAIEDPYIWQEEGVYHALAHAFSPFIGVHAFVPIPPADFDWTLPLNWTVTGVAYNNTVRFTDGSSHLFPRRERPHLVWEPSETKAGKTTGANLKPVALSSGVQYSGRPNESYSDGVFTLLQPMGSIAQEIAKVIDFEETESHLQNK